MPFNKKRRAGPKPGWYRLRGHLVGDLEAIQWTGEQDIAKMEESWGVRLDWDATKKAYLPSVYDHLDASNRIGFLEPGMFIVKYQNGEGFFILPPDMFNRFFFPSDPKETKDAQ